MREVLKSVEIDHGKMALDLFPNESSADEYKELVLVLTYRAVYENPRIKLRTLYWTLRSYNIHKKDVDCALSGLLNVFKCVVCWGQDDKNYIIKTSKTFNSWLQEVTTSNPNLLAYDVKKKGN